MDPLSVSTGVAGFISLGLEVTKLLVQFYKDYAGQAADLSHTTRRLSVLSATLGGLKSHLDNRKFHDGEQELVTVVEEAVCICNDYIDELRHHLAKFEQHKTGTIWSKMGASTSTRQLAYPFRKSTLEKLDRDISEASSSAAFALQVLQEGIMARTYDQIEQVSERLGVVYGMTKESTINDWLQAPDSSATYNVACAKKEPGTGLWFVQGQAFTSWLSAPNSFLWIYGFAGTGKSVLCSTAIQHARRYRQSSQRIGIAFYFFSFAHGGEQTVSEMLRSLVLQLSNQCDFTLLEKLHDRYKNKTPPNEARLSCLQRLLQSFENVCVFLDALDECVRDNFGPCDQWDELLETINLIRGWSIPGLHMLTTSRDDPEIRDTLGPSTDERISMKNPAVNSDIARFIDAQLKCRKRLQKWSTSHELMKSELLRQADGVFRWVECQFTSLEKCLTLRQLRETLSKLPPTLGETYERFLGNVPDEHVEYTRRVLSILCCAVRELSVDEVRLAAAVEIGNDDAKLDPVDVLNENAIFSLCPGFFETFCRGNNDPGHAPMRIAHASVQEYLQSEDIGRWNARAARLRVRKSNANGEMASICLALGLYMREQAGSPAVLDAQFDNTWLPPFVDATRTYFADHWPDHYLQTDTPSHRRLPEILALRLFIQQRPPRIWMNLGYEDVARNLLDGAADLLFLFFAASLGLDFLIPGMVSDAPWCRGSSLLNQSLGPFGTAILAAAVGGHASTVKTLVELGADINKTAGIYGTALLAAAMRGHTSTVKTLVDLGADVNTTAGFFGTALKQAAQAGHVATVSELLIGGADVDAGGALHEAAAKGHTGIVQLLIDHGVALNAKNGIRAFTALQYSVKHGHTATATLLIERGADINVSHCFEGTAVDIAARGGHEGLVRLLISSGVDIERWSKCEQETTGDLRSRLAKQSDRFSTFETVD